MKEEEQCFSNNCFYCSQLQIEITHIPIEIISFPNFSPSVLTGHKDDRDLGMLDDVITDSA